jgi:hypothetical protein
MDNRTPGLLLLVLGVAAAGAGPRARSGALVRPGRLPGDVRIGSGSVRVYLPFTSMLRVPAALALVAHGVRRVV